MELVVAVVSQDTTINKGALCNDALKTIIIQRISTVTRAVKKLCNLFMTARLLRFKAEAAIPAARPRALSAGYTSDSLPLILRRGPEKIFHSTAAAHLLKSINHTIHETETEFVPILSKC